MCWHPSSGTKRALLQPQCPGLMAGYIRQDIGIGAEVRFHMDGIG